MPNRTSSISMRYIYVYTRNKLFEGLYIPAVRYVRKFNAKYFYEELICLGNKGLK